MLRLCCFIKHSKALFTLTPCGIAFGIYTVSILKLYLLCSVVLVFFLHFINE